MRRHPSTPARAGYALAALMMLALAGCGTLPAPGAKAPLPAGAAKPPGRPDASHPVLPPAGSGRGGYYKDDGPGENPPPGLNELPDAEVRVEAPLPRSNRPYVVFGKTYTPITDQQPFTQRGVGSWYGKKFHGQRTSSGELYDMYKMTAAHPTLPIPSYARLTSIVNGRQVIVRINDRGPFHASRAIDVSYTAALKLGLLGKGSHELQIERLLPAEIERIRAARQSGATAALAAPVAAPQAEAQTGAVLTPETTPLLLNVAAPSAMAQALSLAQPSSATPQASMTAQPAAATAAGEAAPARNGYYLQLGAYARADNAEAARKRLAEQAGNFATLEVVKAGSVHRLYGGPFASRQEALQAAGALPGGFSQKPIIVQR